MSTTPEEIAEWLCDFARYMRLASPEGDPFCDARLTQAAALIRAQAERVRVLEDALREIADHSTGGVGCNPQSFVEIASAALRVAP